MSKVSKYRKAVAAFLAPFLLIPTLGAQIAGDSVLDVKTLLAAAITGLIAAASVFLTPNAQ